VKFHNTDVFEILKPGGRFKLKMDEEILGAVDGLTKGLATSSLTARPMFESPDKEFPNSTDTGGLPLSCSAGGRSTASVDKELKTPAFMRTLSENDTRGCSPGTLPTSKELPSRESDVCAKEALPVENVLVPITRLIIDVD